MLRKTLADLVSCPSPRRRKLLRDPPRGRVDFVLLPFVATSYFSLLGEGRRRGTRLRGGIALRKTLADLVSCPSTRRRKLLRDPARGRVGEFLSSGLCRHIYLHPPWGGSKARDEASGRDSVVEYVGRSCRRSPPRVVASSSATLPASSQAPPRPSPRRRRLRRDPPEGGRVDFVLLTFVATSYFTLPGEGRSRGTRLRGGNNFAEYVGASCQLPLPASSQAPP